jgi:hypothetical protein
LLCYRLTHCVFYVCSTDSCSSYPMCFQPKSDFHRFSIKRMCCISCTLCFFTSFMYLVADFCSVTVIHNNNYDQAMENIIINHLILLVPTFRRNLLPPPSGCSEKVNCSHIRTTYDKSRICNLSSRPVGVLCRLRLQVEYRGKWQQVIKI